MDEKIFIFEFYGKLRIDRVLLNIFYDKFGNVASKRSFFGFFVQKLRNKNLEPIKKTMRNAFFFMYKPGLLLRKVQRTISTVSPECSKKKISVFGTAKSNFFADFLMYLCGYEV